MHVFLFPSVFNPLQVYHVGLLLLLLQVRQLRVLLERSVRIYGLGLQVQPMLSFNFVLKFQSSRFCGQL